MNPIKTSFLQRGALLIVAVVLILVIAVLVLSLSFMAASNLGSSGGHVSSAQALYIAESGIESALRRLHQPGRSCTSDVTSGVSETGMLVGQGEYTTIVTTFNPPISGHTVTSAMNAVGTIVPVTAPITDFAPHGRVHIEFEEIDYSGTSTSAAVCGTAPCLTGARRGAAGTTAAAHAVGVGVNQNLCLIRSTGTAGAAQRVVERTIHSPDAMIVYSIAQAPTEDVTDTPFYRVWNQLASLWGSQLAATEPEVVAAPQIRHMVIKFARTRNEAILGTLDTTGDIRVQVWNGFVWGPTQLLANVGGGNSASRGFDIAYETGNDRAIVVYNNANNRNPAYRTWSGGPTWSAAVTLDTEIGGNYPTASPPIWIDLARNPLRDSNEIVMITQKATGEVFGVQWDGARWNDRSAPALTAWDIATDGNDRMAIGVAYEQLSGQAMFVWGGDTLAPSNLFRTWDGATTTLTAIDTTATAPLDIPAQGGISQWVRLVAQPNSNNLMFGVQDASNDLNTRFWNGTAWDTAAAHPEHDATTEDVGNRNFDIVFETHPVNPGIAWIVWGDEQGGAIGGVVSRRRWGGAAWGAVAAGIGDDTNLVQLLAQPGTGAVFAGHYEDTAATNPDELLAASLINGAPAWPVPPLQIISTGSVDPLRTRLFFGARGHVSIGRREVYP